MRKNGDVKTRMMPNSELLPYVAELVASGRQVILPAKGNSMLPTIWWGRDSVELVRPEAVCPGMIALCRLGNGAFVLHRIESVDGDVVTLRGDGNLQGRERCHRVDVMAVASHIVRRSGRKTDCSSAGYRRVVKFWLSMPYFVKRVVLALCRRINGTNG